MSTIVTLADGREVSVAGGMAADGRNEITFQFLSPDGAALGAPAVLAVSDPGGFTTSPVVHVVDPSTFTVAALSDGGFEVVYRSLSDDSAGLTAADLMGVRVSAGGQVSPGQFIDQVSPVSRVFDGFASNLHATELGGDRFAVTYDAETGDEPGQLVHRLALATAQGGAYATVALDAGGGVATSASGDVTVTWSENGATLREVLSPDGSVLMARGVSKVLTIGVASDTDLERADFDPGHDQLRLVNADGSVAGGAHSTLTYDARSHTLTFDPDSEGPAPATQAAMFVDPKAAAADGQPFDVASLASDFRPAVLKVVEADGSQDVTWFDTDGSKPWDTLHAVFTPQGGLATYASTNDDGTGQRFTFDVDGVQPWTRYVDQLDPTGHVTERTVLYDDGTSWTAKFAFSGGQVVSYELDSFDAAGHQVGTSFFHADGTPF